MTVAELAPERPRQEPPPGPWNPGVRSRLPGRLLALSTIFRPENVSTALERVRELHELTGFEFGELVGFRPVRLALHELLIRVTADLSVSDGSRYEDLGINFRRIVSTVFTRYVEPDLPRIEAIYADARERLSAVIAAELKILSARAPAAASGAARPNRLRSLLGLGSPRSRRDTTAEPEVGEDAELLRAADDCDARAAAAADLAQSTALAALARTLRALYGKIGHWGTGSELVQAVALDLACNTYCSAQIGARVGTLLQEATRVEGYHVLPPRDPAIVMNTKGPSASGKSTLRPLQHALADRIGVQWSEFALISPDIWRKQLLDYASLGPDHRYGGMLTSEELLIIDRKLDRYVERKAESGRISHLLIDRFRFGSFVFQSDRGSNKLLSRFGQKIYFFFMITPPEALVERAWTRGLEYGRYKAVDDLLAHGVEAYSGMPQLFLTWARRTDKEVHFEFLDNSVEFGCPPRTIAFGVNSRLFILDPKGLIDVVRYRRVNVDAHSPDDLYRDVSAQAMAPRSNADFVQQCVRQLDEVVFADRASGRVYVRMSNGRVQWTDAEALAAATHDEYTLAALQAVAPEALGTGPGAPPEAPGVGPGPRPVHVADLVPEARTRTLGDWGPGAVQ
jgi:hypothetical protein